MLAAVMNGDVKKVAELMRQDPGFKVNMSQDVLGRTILHLACDGDRSSAVIPLLLAHPGINVNAKTKDGQTPFYSACGGRPSCVRELLKDSRVKVNEPAKDGSTPLWFAARYGFLDVMKWCIASGREIDLGEPGNARTDAIGLADRYGYSDVVTLLERFKENRVETNYAVRVELGFVDELAAEMFALVVFVSDGLLQVKKRVNPKSKPAARFFRIASRLPLELQMVLCCHGMGSPKEVISGQDSGAAFKRLSKWS